MNKRLMLGMLLPCLILIPGAKADHSLYGGGVYGANVYGMHADPIPPQVCVNITLTLEELTQLFNSTLLSFCDKGDIGQCVYEYFWQARAVP